MIAILIVRATAGGGPTQILPLVVIRQESLFSLGRRDLSSAAVCEVRGYGGWHYKKLLECQKVGISAFSILTPRIKAIRFEIRSIKLSLEHMTLLFLIMLGLDLEIPRFIWLDMGSFFT